MDLFPRPRESPRMMFPDYDSITGYHMVRRVSLYDKSDCDPHTPTQNGHTRHGISRHLKFYINLIFLGKPWDPALPHTGILSGTNVAVLLSESPLNGPLISYLSYVNLSITGTLIKNNNNGIQYWQYCSHFEQLR